MVTLHTCQIDINKRLAPHFLETTSLAHSLMRQVAFSSWREEKGGASLGGGFYVLVELSLEHLISYL